MSREVSKAQLCKRSSVLWWVTELWVKPVCSSPTPQTSSPLNMYPRSGGLRQVTTSELSSDRCLPRLFLRRFPLLLRKCQRKGWPSLPSICCCLSSSLLPVSLTHSLTRVFQWVPEITHHCPKTPFLLVGTQIDLRDDPSTIEKLAKNKQKPITLETAEKLAKDLKAVKYVECSALTQVRPHTLLCNLTHTHTHSPHTCMSEERHMLHAPSQAHASPYHKHVRTSSVTPTHLHHPEITQDTCS
uniref:Uncharacterized protein n=1 Tax=Oncorhynchus mykiss TaxID=8022 RepID=A0A8C7PLF5_ONCMY